MTDRSTILLSRAMEIAEQWRCQLCGSRRYKSIRLYLLDDNDNILEHIVCFDCAHDDHSALLYNEIEMEYEGSDYE